LETNHLPAHRGVERGGGRGRSPQGAFRRGSKMEW